MHDARELDGTVVIRGFGELARAELTAIAERAREVRAAGREVVLDFRRVSHLHYAGAALLAPIRGIRVIVASRYVTDLLHAGGVLAIEDAREPLELPARSAVDP